MPEEKPAFRSLTQKDCSIVNEALSAAIERELKILGNLQAKPAWGHAADMAESVRQRERLVKSYEGLRRKLRSETNSKGGQLIRRNPTSPRCEKMSRESSSILLMTSHKVKS
jgi:hypothetical protein